MYAAGRRKMGARTRSYSQLCFSRSHPLSNQLFSLMLRSCRTLQARCCPSYNSVVSLQIISITHSGWNSTVESAAAGEPMVCWPCSCDLLVNSRFVGEVWKVGLDMQDMCKGEIVESMVRKAMEGEKAEELRQMATEMAVEIGRSVGKG